MSDRRVSGSRSSARLRSTCCSGSMSSWTTSWTPRAVTRSVQHLAECEPCLDRFDVEQAVKTLVHRCCGSEVAPQHLRTRIVSQLTVIRRTM